MALSPLQVQMVGQQQGQMVGQVLQVPCGSHQQLQGVTTAQLIQAGDLTEEQQQQVHYQNTQTLYHHIHVDLFNRLFRCSSMGIYEALCDISWKEGYTNTIGFDYCCFLDSPVFVCLSCMPSWWQLWQEVSRSRSRP